MIYRAQIFGLADSLATNPTGLRRPPVLLGEALVTASSVKDVESAAVSAWTKVIGIDRGIVLKKMGAPDKVRRAVTNPGSSAESERLVCISVVRRDVLERDYEFIYNNGVEMWLICLSAVQDQAIE